MEIEAIIKTQGKTKQYLTNLNPKIKIKQYNIFIAQINYLALLKNFLPLVLVRIFRLCIQMNFKNIKL